MDNSIKKSVNRLLKKYEVTDNLKSLRIYITTLSLTLFFLAGGIYAFGITIYYGLFFVLPASFMLCRCFALEHDAGHRSLFTKVSYNKIAGFFLGFITMVPSAIWTDLHNVHHGILGNLDKRDVNPELWTMTLDEYKAASAGKKRLYRFVRSKFMRIIITPLLWMIAPRIPVLKFGWKNFFTTIIHNLLYILVFYYLIQKGYQQGLILVYFLSIYLFNVAASIMFYVQHQFEHTFWEEQESWDFFTATIKGSSYVDLHPVLRWMTGNVGCHHVHHLNTRIPCYLLRNATEEADQQLKIQRIYLRDILKQFDFVVWDAKNKIMVRFKDI